MSDLQALYDYLPSENDLQPLLAWLAVMEKAHIHLARYYIQNGAIDVCNCAFSSPIVGPQPSTSCSLQSSLSLGHLPRLFSAAMSCLLSPHTQVVSAATNTLKVRATQDG